MYRNGDEMMKDINLEDLTGGNIYILELDDEIQAEENLTLVDMKVFLKSFDDMPFIDNIIKYEVPFLFKVLKFQDNVSFLYIVTYAGRIKNNADTKNLQKLLPYSRILGGYCKISYLPTLLFNAAFKAEHIENVLQESDINKVIQDVFMSEDIFVAYGRGSAEKDALAMTILNRFSANTAHSTTRYTMSIDAYKEKVMLQNRPDFSLVNRIEKIRANFVGFAFSYKSTLATLEDIGYFILPIISKQLLLKLNSCINSINRTIVTRKAFSVNVMRLIRTVYSIPRNQIIYNDNGEFVLREAIIRLERFQPYDLIASETEELKALAHPQERTEGWFLSLNEIRRKLLIKISPIETECILKSEREEIVALLDEILYDLKLGIGEQHKQQTKILNNFLQNIDSETLNQYIGEVTLEIPCQLGGTTLIDMDSCLDEDIIIDSLIKADKIIILGSHMKGLFKILFDAARCQELKDGKTRVSILNSDSKRHPLITEFINNCFYQLATTTSLNVENDDNNGLPVFVWLPKNSPTLSLSEHIYEILMKGFRVGVLAFNKEEINQTSKILQTISNEFENLTIGTDADFYAKEFDVLYIIANNSAEDKTKLSTAMSKALKTVVVVEDYKNIKTGGYLQHFYYVCIGDEQHGRVYN